MLVRGGGALSGYVSTGFFGGKYISSPFCFSCVVERIFFIIRSYSGSCRLGRGD